jgi:uncharacterized protein (DUF1786 family)
MQVLAVDVGTGTQDIYLLRTGMSPENGLKLVMPSPTMLTRERIRDATRRGVDILLTGVTMGGGPSHWAAEDHIQAGLNVYATSSAARSFNDDTELLEREMGIQLVAEEETGSLPSAEIIELRDFDYGAISSAFNSFGVSLNPAAIGVAVFDHGEAPPDVSDRKFRFDYLERRLHEKNRLSAFAFPSHQIPPILTRMQAVASSVDVDCPLFLMDTAPAAVLGARQDDRVAQRPRTLIINVGNFHTLAFRMQDQIVEGVFEHHTGMLTQAHLEDLLVDFAAGILTRERVFAENGHGALIFDPNPLPLDFPDFGIVVTGPRRSMLAGSRLRPYFAVPHGDMMLSGCFGLLAAMADHLPELTDEISATLAGDYNRTAPWDVDNVEL